MTHDYSRHGTTTLFGSWLCRIWEIRPRNRGSEP
jgi:hypothetical protein